MGLKLHGILGSLKDQAALTTTSSATDAAVLRATPHRPSSSPPSPTAISALLSFGHSSRLSANSLVRSLTGRLSSARHPSVTLKSLLCLHHLLLHGSFILTDSLSSSLAPSSGRRSPLNLSSYNNSSSLPLSLWVRWYARLLELLLSVRALVRAEELTTLLNKQLVAELDLLTAVVEEINRAPDRFSLEDNRLISEVLSLAEAERVSMQQGIVVRVREMKERMTELGFADSIELACLFRRLEECKLKWKGWELFWSEEVRGVKERVERREEEAKGKVRRERLSESARVVGRVTDEHSSVLFGSTRVFKSLMS